MKLTHQPLALEHGKPYDIILHDKENRIRALFIDKNKRKNDCVQNINGLTIPDEHFFLTKEQGKYHAYTLDKIRLACKLKEKN